MGYRLEKGSTPTIVFVMVDATDDETEETGLSPAVTISKNGGAFAAVTNAVSHIGNGFYKVTLTATETNTDGPLAVRASASGADVFRDVYYVETTSTAAVSVTITATQYRQIADHVLRRTLANARASSDGDTVSQRSLLGALALLVNRRGYDAVNDELDVYQENDSTVFYSVPATTSGTAVNIIELNPSG